MSLRQVVRPRSSNNGYGRWRAERDTGVRLESRLQAGKSDARKLLNAGEPISKARDEGSCSRDRLVYLAACLIGHDVEVQVRNGSIYAGIFHATNAEDDFGIILKMARLIKDGSSQGQIAISESISTAPSKVLIIPAKELVQVMAKDVSLTMDRLTNELQEKQQEILLDSFISQSHQLEMERELQPWVPDDDAPRPEFENVFDEPWNRKWDQFEANETLFGVKSTFDEELYTTKLEKGPQMRELEREASRLAKEIEGEETHDSHTAEERGFQYHDDLDIDEETRYSSVSRGIDDNGYKENEDANVDSCNSETFEGSSDSVTDRSLAGLKSCQSTGAPVSNNSSTTEEANAFQLGSPRSLYHPNSDDHAKQLASELVSKHVPALDGERVRDDESSGSFQPDGCAEKKIPAEEDQLSNAEDLHSSLDIKNDLCDKGSLSPNAISYAPASCFASSGEEKANSVEISGGASFSKTQVTAPSGNSRAISGGFTASPSECVGNASPFSGPKLSPSSSAGSLSSEKSVLNPHAKEFKLNPNAKSFIPSPALSVRPPSPGCDGSLYFPPTVSAGPHMAASGFGMGHQAVVVNPQGAYYSANGPPQYGQQMIVGHPRPYLYMPNYPHEMAYKGRDF